MTTQSTMHLHRFGYAVSLFAGAERIIREETKPKAAYVVSAYLLLGFSVENALAAYLIACRHNSPSDYKSHRLLGAMNASIKHGLKLSNDGAAFITKIDRYHRDFVFRYPEKMTKISLNVQQGLVSAYSVIRDVRDGMAEIGADPIIQIPELIA